MGTWLSLHTIHGHPVTYFFGPGGIVQFTRGNRGALLSRCDGTAPIEVLETYDEVLELAGWMVPVPPKAKRKAA